MKTLFILAALTLAFVSGAQNTLTNLYPLATNSGTNATVSIPVGGAVCPAKSFYFQNTAGTTYYTNDAYLVQASLDNSNFITLTNWTPPSTNPFFLQVQVRPTPKVYYRVVMQNTNSAPRAVYAQ